MGISSFETLAKYIFFTTFIISTNMPHAQQKKRAQLGPTEILVSLIFLLPGYSEILVVLETNLKF